MLWVGCGLEYWLAKDADEATEVDEGDMIEIAVEGVCVSGAMEGFRRSLSAMVFDQGEECGGGTEVGVGIEETTDFEDGENGACN